MKKAIITGVTGQDGSYLAEFLLEKGYEVHGIRRRTSTFNLENLSEIKVSPHNNSSNFFLHYGDMTDSSNLNRLIDRIKPDEIYNLAAQSHVHVSFEVPEYTAEVDAVGTIRILDAIKASGIRTKFYQASTSELYGKVQEVPQSETTPFYPRSPYAVAKQYAYWIVKNYREAYDLFACNGILFNHESPRRGEAFVTRKITTAIAKIVNGRQKKLYLGNIDAKRDWGYAKDYVEAMWLMLQQEKPEDYVIATGVTTSIRVFVEKAFKYANIDIEWKGEGVDEKAYDKKTGIILVEIDPFYFRPTEVDLLIGDGSKAEKELGWKAKTQIDELIEIMMKSDLEKEKNK